MRRSLLLTTSVLGLLICLIGGTGLFAALTDSAHTGTNTVDSAALPNSADLQLATASIDDNGVACDAFSDNLATGLFSYSNISRPWAQNAPLCIKNAGSVSVTLSTVVDQLTDVDTACTGNEADYGDTTCGDDLAGELSSVLTTVLIEIDCEAVTHVDDTGFVMLAAAVEPAKLGSVGAGQTKCYMVSISYSTSADTAAQQKAQSDQVTWRYVFSGQS